MELFNNLGGKICSVVNGLLLGLILFPMPAQAQDQATEGSPAFMGVIAFAMGCYGFWKVYKGNMDEMMKILHVAGGGLLVVVGIMMIASGF